MKPPSRHARSHDDHQLIWVAHKHALVLDLAWLQGEETDVTAKTRLHAQTTMLPKLQAL